MFLNMVRTESIDLSSCRVIHVEAEAAGVALIARRGWTSRLAAMCLGPAARGRGAGRAAMEMLLQEASARGERGMVLEVIESNAPGVRLYQACGFRTERRLLSFQGRFPTLNQTADLQEIDIREAARTVARYGLDDLPWQLAGESLAQSGPPGKAFRLDRACIVISSPAAEQVAIRSVIVEPEARRQGQATRLIQSVLAKYSQKNWLVSALCPEEIGGLFEKAGFQRDSLSQLQMRIELTPLQER